MMGNLPFARNDREKGLTLCGGDRKLDTFSAYLQIVAVESPSCGRDS
jgi:hypothetical protein